MHDIDFLPNEYRQQHQRRQVQPWRVIVVAMFVALLAGAAMTQYRQKAAVKNDLAALTPLFDEAGRETARLGELQSRLQAARTDAELLTYLRHPWPRTPDLAALAGSVPADVTLSQVQISREPATNQPAVAQGPQADKKAEEEKARKRLPAERDLKRFRDELDRAATVVRIAGTAVDSSNLHRYLAVLGKNDLFLKTDLRSMESAGLEHGAALRFQAVLTVRPGYGQPGGPVAAGTIANCKLKIENCKLEIADWDSSQDLRPKT